VPTDAEWDTLQNYLIANGYNYDGSLDSNKIAKAVASSKFWSLPSSKIYDSLKSGAICNNVNTNNKSGFSAIPEGYREWNGYFWLNGIAGCWWSCTLNLEMGANEKFACSRHLCSIFSKLISNSNALNFGLSVRLVKN